MSGPYRSGFPFERYDPYAPSPTRIVMSDLVKRLRAKADEISADVSDPEAEPLWDEIALMREAADALERAETRIAELEQKHLGSRAAIEQVKRLLNQEQERAERAEQGLTELRAALGIERAAGDELELSSDYWRGRAERAERALEHMVCYCAHCGGTGHVEINEPDAGPQTTRRPCSTCADARAAIRKAAAPDLLAALEELVALTDRKHVVWDRARAAIRKARAAAE